MQTAITAITQFSAKVGEIVTPPNLDTLDHATVISAIERLRAARIAKLAIYIFSTSLILAVATLTEAGAITAMVAIPALLVSLVCWSLFFRLNGLDCVYMGNADDRIRENLAKKHLECVLFEIPLAGIKTIEQLCPVFIHINMLLGVDIFTVETLKPLAGLNLSDSGSRTLFDIAQEQSIPLLLDLQADFFERGRFGLPSYHHKAAVQWDGAKDSDIIIHMQTVVEQTNAENLPDTTETDETDIK